MTPPPDPPKVHHILKIEKIEVFQNVSHDIPIDAKFDADFKNVTQHFSPLLGPIKFFLTGWSSCWATHFKAQTIWSKNVG